MSLFKVDWCETKQSSKGSDYKRATLTDDQGKTTENVAIFTFFKDYANVAPGRTISGVIEEKVYNGKPSYSLKDVITYKSFQKQPTQIAKAMEKKEESISKFQDNKELSIKISSTIRMATDVAIAEGNPSEENIKKWREFFWRQFDVNDQTYEPF